jgi:hypothetical protein
VRDGATLGPAALGVSLPVDPGTHACVLRAPHRVDVHQDVTIREGEERTVELMVGAPAPESPPPDDAHASHIGSSQRTLALVTLGTGAVIVGVGSVLGIVAKTTYDAGIARCPSGPDSCDPHGVTLGKNAHTDAQLSTAAFITGGVLLAGGAALYLTVPKASPVRVAPAVGAAGGRARGGVEIGGVW